MSWSLILEIFGFCVGILYLWWEYHANRLVWVASIIMPAISMWIYFSKGIYADFAINIYYFLIAIYGYCAWTFGGKTKDKNGKQQEELPITRLGLRTGLILTVILAGLWLLLAWVLLTFTDSTIPYWDAFTTALSIVAMWMLARKIAEQWLAWFVVDIVCVGLYIYKGLVLYPVLYAAYTLIALLGYRKWLRLMTAQADTPAGE